MPAVSPGRQALLARKPPVQYLASTAAPLSRRLRDVEKVRFGTATLEEQRDESRRLPSRKRVQSFDRRGW
jgi:hypothetical protein